MADSKITALTALTAADPVNDMFPVVDVSDTSMAASGTTKRISANNILSSSPTASGALTVTGLVTAGSATITGDLTVDTSTLKVDSTNNRVGIGTASPVNPFDVASTSGTLAVFKRTGSNGAFIGLEDGSGSGLAYLGVTSGTFSIQTPGSGYSDKLSVDSSGNVLVGVASANANGGVLQLKSGITFPATQVASSDANTLDDYEEGTWTGSLLGVTTNPTVAVTATGSYTKIGRIVRIAIQFSNVSTVGASGQLTVSGIPFTNSSIAAIGNAFIGNSIVTITGPVFAAVGSGASSNVDLVCQLTSGDTTTANHSAGTGKYLTINTVYTV